MKTTRSFLTALALLPLLGSGCNKNQDSATQAPPPAMPAASQAQQPQQAAAETVKKAEQAVQAQKPAAEQAANHAAAQSNLAMDVAKAQAQALIDQAQKLVTGTKYDEAANILKQLAAMKLTPDQQKLVSDLQGAVQKALASKAAADGAKAVGDLFKKK